MLLCRQNLRKYHELFSEARRHMEKGTGAYREWLLRSRKEAAVGWGTGWTPLF